MEQRKEFSLDISKYMTVHLGRHSQCELVLEGNDISRQHALITNQNGNYILKDKLCRGGEKHEN